MADTFVEIKDIPGDSETEGYKGQIDATSWQWSASQQANMQDATGGAASNSHVGDFMFSKAIDKASPNLMQYCALGKHIDEIKIHMTKSSGDTVVEWYTVTLKKCIISSVSVSGGGGSANEQVSINFAEYQVQQFVQDDKGQVKAGPDVKYSAREKKPM